MSFVQRVNVEGGGDKAIQITTADNGYIISKFEGELFVGNEIAATPADVTAIVDKWLGIPAPNTPGIIEELKKAGLMD